ncbi:MAG TPA: gliding motility-associated C-terminal domain-containing protein [Saprospiraceae bacterium]|nr:gliding motility-associated C-terminal domain-containing protein [Saprospiraceae bacterium]
MPGKILILFFLCINCLSVKVLAQAGCVTSTGVIYGSPNSNERGKTLVATPGNDGFYVGGSKEDSVVILKMDLMGTVLWSRTFDIIPNEEEHVVAIILDSDGMLALAGIAGDQSGGGTVFGFRYNPNSNQILWAKEYISSPVNYCFSMIQMGAGGNYLMSNNPHHGANIDGELLAINKNTGALIPAFTKNYHLGSAEEYIDLAFHSNFIYGVGRYTDGSTLADMRHTIAKMDANNGTVAWAKMGHVPANLNARLYGIDVVIDQDQIYSFGVGDPVGSGTTNTKLYIQKTDLNGSLIWLRQYDVPGPNEWAYEMIKSNNGFVLLGIKQAAPKDIFMFKIDIDGTVLWAKTYQFSPIVSSVALDRGVSQLIEVGNKLVFTAVGTNATGSTDMIIVTTDLNGDVDIPCVATTSFSITVTLISSPTFYSVNPSVFTVNPGVNSESPEVIESNIKPRQECTITDTLYSLIAVTICDGDQYEGYSVQGTYEDNFTTSEGCDSIRTLSLTIQTPNSTSEQASICLGESYQGYTSSGTYTNLFQNAIGCDSMHTIFLTVIPLTTNQDIVICEGEQYQGYTISGFYTDTLQGPFNECDTIRYLDLTVLPSDATFLTVTICNGDTYEGYSSEGIYSDVFTNILGCDSLRTLDLDIADDIFTEEDIMICLGASYQGFSQPGTYVETLQSILGCDSTHTLNLGVVALEVNLDIEICDGEQFEGYTSTGFYEDTLQGPPNECDTIRYLNLTVNDFDMTIVNIGICLGGNYESYSTSGQYIDFFTNVLGCDSIRTLNLVVSDEILTEINIEICPGSFYEGYSNPGTYIDVFTSTFGCDSIRTLNLSVGTPQLDIDVSICAGGHFENYTVAGEYTDVIPAASGGCDTLRHLSLSIEPPLLSFFDAIICHGENFLGYDESGFYSDTLQTSAGCDSIRSVSLTVMTEIITEVVASICEGDNYENYSITGIYIDTLISINGCDSTRTLNLTVGMPEINLDVVVCAGGQFEQYTQPGTYSDTLQGTSGACDTLRNINLSMDLPPQTFIDRAICDGQIFLGYSSTGIFIDTLQTSSGCDSIRVLNLTVSNVILQNESVGICLGSMYQGYSDPGIYIDTFISVFGCDSIRTLNIFLDNPQKLVNVSICEGGMFDNYTAAGTYIDTIKGVLNSCDTIRYLNISMLPVIQTVLNQTICQGDNFLGYSMTGIYSDTFQTAGGCDSLRTLDLVVTDVFMTDENVEICLGDIYQGHSVAGVYFDTLQSVSTCDSIIALHLKVFANETILDIAICSGQNFENYSVSGIYIDTLPGINTACDTIRHLQLSVQQPFTTSLTKTICAGDNFNGHTASGFYTDTLLTTEGCDSLISVSLTALDQISTHVISSICEQAFPGHSTPGMYIDTLISYRGCDSIRTLELGGGSTYVPNVFSPNEDGVNDLFRVFLSPDPAIELQYFGIFDRFGDLTYETTSWPIEWNGKRQNGEPYNPAVFAYVFIYVCGEEKITETGDITIVK